VSVVANVAVNVDARQATQNLQRLQQQSTNAANSITKTGKSAASATANIQRFGIAFRSVIGPLVAVTGAVNLLSGSLRILGERQADAAALENGLKKIGGTTGDLTRLQAIADKLGKQTLFNQEDFDRGFTLLTSFQSIGVSSYERVAKAAADVAQVTRQDVNSSLMQLAKALQDPEKGLTALARSGTQFTESQKEQVEQLVKSGQQLKAQDFILKEIEKQYGNAATAAGSAGYAGAVDSLQESFRDFQEKLAIGVEPAVVGTLKALSDLFDLISKIPKPVGEAALAIGAVTAQVLLLEKGIKAIIALRTSFVAAMVAMTGATAASGTAAKVSAGSFALYTNNTRALQAQAATATPVLIGLAGALATLAKIGIIAIGIKFVLEGADEFLTGLLGAKQADAAAREVAARRGLTYSPSPAVTKRFAEQSQYTSPFAGARDAAFAAARQIGEPTRPSGGGGGEAKEKGKTDAERAADKAARDAERAAEAAAAREAARVKDVIRDRLAEGQIINLKAGLQDRIAAAEAASDKMLAARLQSAERELEIQYRYAQELAKEANLDAQKAIMHEAQNALTANQIALQRELDELQRQSDQDRLTAVQKYIEKQYELNTAVQRQQQLADGIANTLGEGMASAFDAIIQGSESFGASLRRIASGVLIDIANQLLRIFVIEQAINAIKGVISSLSPFSAATPLGAGGGMVGKFGTLGPNFGIPQRAKGGPVMGGSPYIVGERGPELFVPGSSGTIIPNNKMGGGVSIVVNVDASGSSVEGNEQEGQQLGRVIAAAMQAELIKQKRPGGLLA
jgi:hypothetical protein